MARDQEQPLNVHLKRSCPYAYILDHEKALIRVGPAPVLDQKDQRTVTSQPQHYQRTLPHAPVVVETNATWINAIGSGNLDEFQ